METGVLRIGEFAKLGGVTVKTLRHYESLGLVRPTVTDQRTRYRYYRAEQAADLNAIVALATAGVPLKLIPRLLEADADERAAQLLSLRETMTRRAEQTQQALGLIDALIDEAKSAEQSHAERGNRGPLVLAKCEPARTVRSLRATARSYADVDQLLDELSGSARQAGSALALGTVWHACVPCRIRCEIIADMLPEIGTGRQAWWPPQTSRRLLPATMVASTTHRGDADWSSLYSHVRHWITARGGRPVGPAREWYPDGPNRGLTEIQIPFRQ
jgi:DNA-binding transcriptional MerR regulator